MVKAGESNNKLAGRAVRQMKSVVAQLSTIDVAALYHYHIWSWEQVHHKRDTVSWRRTNA